MRTKIAEVVGAIEPFDGVEREHRDAILEWIRSGAPIFRTRKPDVPPQHLVSYVVVIDDSRNRILLVDHKSACLWLPSGGHVEPDEDPHDTALRELSEELGLAADFIYRKPLFATITRTVGNDSGHVDVSLWYVVRADSSQPIEFDRTEFNDLRWFSFDEVPYERSDPHMRRFIAKLRKLLAAKPIEDDAGGGAHR